MEEWLELQSRLSGFSMTDGRDELVWDLERSGRFTIRSLYYLMTFGGVRDQRMLDVWAAKLPLKIKIFLWMVFHDRTQSAEQLKKRNWKGELNCMLCGVVETTDHILFQCPIANFLWSFLLDAFSWHSAPVSIQDIVGKMSRGEKLCSKRLLIIICAGAMWSLWKTRNDMVFNAKLVKDPGVVVLKMLAFVRHWKMLQRGKDSPKLEEVVKLLEREAGRVAI